MVRLNWQRKERTKEGKNKPAALTRGVPRGRRHREGPGSQAGEGLKITIGIWQLGIKQSHFSQSSSSSRMKSPGQMEVVSHSTSATLMRALQFCGRGWAEA